ncbi:MAG: T9SS type A sorting domain-containing protein [Calditrichaceae bacterium]|nr:T9SS type A sorting domain-containing protein [Calditrichia bacterium]NUQ42018.1 T9SS type A sorting domain-containing protein [Calditrichaceae bacterium]
MVKKLFTVSLVLFVAFSLTGLAKEFNTQKANKVTPQDEELFQQRLNNLTHFIYANPTESLDRVEVGRTWYDYATNNEMGRALAHAYGTGTNGIHAVFMKILPQGAARRVNYDYYDEDLGGFYGNWEITTDRATGWGRVLNGKDDEALVSLHSGLEFWTDASEAGFSFSTLLAGIAPTGVFAGIAREGDVMVYIGQTTNANWSGGDVFKYTTDYGANWLDGDNITISGVTDYGNGERWPSFNVLNMPQLSYLISPATGAGLPLNGSTWLCTTTDWGIANWDVTLIWDDDAVAVTPFGNTQYIIENFSQQNGFYTSDGVYHAVFGAIQGVRDTTTSAAIDYWPILHWDSSTQTFSEVTTLEYSAPDDPTIQAAMANNRPGNGLGNAYPHLAEGPNGELVCVWQQWEKDPVSGGIVLLQSSSGGGTSTVEIFATDIWGAVSMDGGQTWQEPVKLIGNSNESDVYPTITQNVLREGNVLLLDIMWMVDTNAGVSLTNFTPLTDPSECIWYYERVELPIEVGIGDNPASLIDKFALSQNYPNPFNPSTTIDYTLQQSSDISLDVYNLTGQKVATLEKGRKAAGQYTVNFDAANLPSGIYFYTLKAGNASLTQKMVLMK